VGTVALSCLLSASRLFSSHLGIPLPTQIECSGMRLGDRQLQYKAFLFVSLACFCAVGFGQDAVLAVVTASANKTSSQDSVPSCAGAPTGPVGRKSPARHSRHTILLSWTASNPASKEEKDAVKGYYIYRSRVSHRYPPKSRLNEAPIAGTSCVDRSALPRTMYFYSVKAVSQSGVQSLFSGEAKAVIRTP
jgi:hypothetical protein